MHKQRYQHEEAFSLFYIYFILENGIETVDDGTESLDRRFWQQKNRQNGSTHDVMVASVPGPQYLQVKKY